MLFKELNPSDRSRVSALLDAAIEMPSEERVTWLRELDGRDPNGAAALRKFFISQEGCRAQGFLETSDLLPGGLSSLMGADPGLIGRQFGPYRVLSLLGHGGMGGVWLAERVDGLFTRQVALKLLHPALTGRVMTERFAREREILASLNHPHIARLIDAGFAEDGQPYLALEFVSGVPLTTYCDEHRLSIQERLRLYQQVLKAVQYAHAHLVIHRDLKPSNILVTEDGQVYLLDFGIAKLLIQGEAKETELTQLGGRALTPDYAAPEQIAGAPITTAADIYALGVMLYELLTGERPYKIKRVSRGALEEAILRADPTAPSRVAFDETAAGARATTGKKLARMLTGDLDTIVNKALKKPPTERYATVNAFDEDITRFLRGAVVLAQPDSVAYRALKFGRRHRLALVVSGALLLTLAGGLAATSYEAEVASVQRDAALQAQLRSLTQTAAARLKDSDAPGALGIIVEVLPHRGANRPYTSEALSVFQEARAADAQVLAITGHTDRLRHAVFSPDGRRIATAAEDNTARIWDAATGREIMVLSGHGGGLRTAVFSPDGRRVVTASADNTARIWDAATGREVMVLNGHSGGLRSAAFSSDGRRIVTAAEDYTARLWDAAAGREIMLLKGHAGVVTCASFSPDGSIVATASMDKTARLWNAETGREIATLEGHTQAVNAVAFSPDGRRVATASLDKTVRIWNAASGRQIMVIGHPDIVVTAEFSPDGRRIVTALDDKTARIWDADTGREITQLSGHSQQLASAVFSPDGLYVVTASFDKTARVWDAGMSQEQLRLSGHTAVVNWAAFSPDGRRIATASIDKTARIWDAATGRETASLNGHTQSVLSAEFTPDGRRVVTASMDKTARIWDAATGRELTVLSGHQQQVDSAEFSPDGLRVVTASLDKTARIWDAATGRQLMTITHTDLVETAAYSPDGRSIVTALDDNTARIWDAATGRQIMVLRGHTNTVATAKFSPDSLQVVTASEDNTARIWDAATGRQMMLLRGHTQPVDSAEFAPDGRRVVTASLDKTARVWDTGTGQQIMAIRHADLVVTASFSPDGRHIVTAADDKNARVWDASAPAIDAQISWATAALFDALPSTARFQLGLPAPTDVRQWPDEVSKCDASAAAPYDPDRRASGVALEQIVADIALIACTDDNGGSGNQARSMYQHGRALSAGGKFSSAARDFEGALAHGYRAARVDLAMLLSRAAAGMQDIPRAVALYRQAWGEGVTIAAFALGTLYERGIGGSDRNQAWFWYQKAADAGEPNALARLAEQQGAAAFSEQNAQTRNLRWLASFKFYAAAVERARIEDWPDEAWRNWRYHRASLARLLQREGMTREVALAYDDVRKQYAPPATIWQRLTSSVGRDSP